MRNPFVAGAVVLGMCLAPAAFAADATKEKKAEKKAAAPKPAPVAAPKPPDKAAEKGIILQKDAKPAQTKGIILQKPADKKAPDTKAKTPGG